METDTATRPGQMLKCPNLSGPKLKTELQEDGSNTILWYEDENIVDFRLESNLCLAESSYIKQEPRTFEKIKVESSDDRNIDKEFDTDVPSFIKKETNDVNEIAAKTLIYSHERPIKPEMIKQEEIHIKDEPDVENNLNKITPKPREQVVLHQCPECLYKTTNKYHFKRHSIRHKNPDEIDWYKCKECLYKTSRKGLLKIHSEVHNNVLLKCLKCSYKTVRSTEFKKHQLEHKPGTKWLYCPECSFKSHQPCSIQRHILAHKRDAFKCSKCSYQSRTKGQLTIHQVSHESMDKWHSCSLCPFKCFSKSTFDRHCRRRHSIDPNNPNHMEIYKCTECSYESGCKSTLKTHQLIHDESSWFQCPDCAYNTTYKNILKKHMMQHQGENAEGWHRCLECSYKTPYKSSLQRHVISHKSADEIKWIKCSQCSFKTAHQENIKRHQLMKHKEAQEIDWFCCNECAFKTKQKSSLIIHVSKHKKQIDRGSLQKYDNKKVDKNPFKIHQVLHQPENGEGLHRCMECCFETASYFSLRRHVMTHKSTEEIQQFECPQCSFKTARKQALYRHHLQHKEAHEIEWFCCYQCSFKSKYKSSLVNHLLKHKK